VAFAELADGSLAEIIEDPSDSTHTLFAVWKDSQFHYAERIDEDGLSLFPILRKSGVLRHIALPSGLRSFQSAPQMALLAMNFVSRCVDTTLQNLLCAGLWCASTWLADRIEVAPYLFVVGPPQSGKTTLLNVLNLICRHAWLVGDSTPAALYHSFDQLTPTLLFDGAFTQVGQSRSSFRHLLRLGTSRESVARYGYSGEVLARRRSPRLGFPTIPAS
jgi:hypothetical protein